MWLEFFVEEQSMEAALQALVPSILPNAEYEIHPFRGKYDLLKNLPHRLKAYGQCLPTDYKLVVLVDRDDSDCHELKAKLEQFAARAGLETISKSPDRFQIINRIVIEELEAWFFGDVKAIHEAYPRVPVTLGNKVPYRDPDSISGGTCEKLEKLLKDKGYHRGGLEKIRAAQDISKHMDPDRNRSRSFQVFRDALRSIPEQTC